MKALFEWSTKSGKNDLPGWIWPAGSGAELQPPVVAPGISFDSFSSLFSILAQGSRFKASVQVLGIHALPRPLSRMALAIAS